MAKKIETLVAELVQQVFPSEYELVDVEYVKEAGVYYLRVYADKVGGLTLDDCQYLSKIIGTLLDEKDPISDTYMLEISSPGLERPLKKPKDFLREQGKLVLVKLYKAVDGQKEFQGILLPTEEDQLLRIEDNGVIHAFSKEQVALVRLQITF